MRSVAPYEDMSQEAPDYMAHRFHGNEQHMEYEKLLNPAHVETMMMMMMTTRMILLLTTNIHRQEA